MDWVLEWWNFQKTEDNFFSQAVQEIGQKNNLVAMETTEILERDEIEIRTLESLTQEEYEKIRLENDPEHRDTLVGKVVGLFIYPDNIFVQKNLSDLEVERTIVHEIQHYRNRDSGMTPIEDEISAVEAEDRYVGKYITRKYIRDLKENVEARREDL